MLQFMPSKSTAAGILGLVLAISLAGCSDDPEHRAAKQARRSSKKALDIFRADGDFEAARKELKKALALAGEAGGARDTAVFIGADLTFAEAEAALGPPAAGSGVQAQRAKLLALADEISATAGKVRKLKFEQDRLNAAAAARQAEINKLTKMLTEGHGQRPSLKSQFAEYQKKLQELETEKQRLRLHVDETEKQADELQRQADLLLRKAEQAPGQEKIELQRRAYGLLLDRNYSAKLRSAAKHESGESAAGGLPGMPALLARAQRGRDLISAIDSQLALIKPTISRLNDNIAEVEKRINEMKTSPNAWQLDMRLGEIGAKLSRQRQNILKLIRDLKNAKSDYSAGMAQIVNLLVRAGKEYKKVRPGPGVAVSETAKLARADCSYRTALLCAENMGFEERFGTRLARLRRAGLAEKATTQRLNEIADRCRQKADDYGSKAVGHFTDAVEQYEKLSRTLRRRKDEFACSVVKNHTLALIGKARLAEQLGKDKIAGDCLAQARQLAAEAAEYDRDFANSAAAALLRQEPQEAVIPPDETPAAGMPGVMGMGIAAMKQQIRAQMQAQLQALMALPEQERQNQLALLIQAIRTGDTRGVPAEQLAELEELLRQGNVEKFFKIMEQAALQAIEQMAPMPSPPRRGEMQKGFEKMAEESQPGPQDVNRPWF